MNGQVNHYMSPNGMTPSGAATPTNGVFTNMGPPTGPVQKPQDKPIDTNDLADVLAGGVVDLKDEEMALQGSYFGSQPQASNNNYQYQPPNASFTSSPSTVAHTPNASFDNSFNAGSQGGSFGPPVPQSQYEEQRRNEQIRALATSKQYHLNEPFLGPGALSQKVKKASLGNRLRLPIDDIMQSRMGQQIHADNSLADMVTILSLAANDRLRGLVETARVLSSSRRKTAHGQVPTEWADLAISNGQESAVLSKASLQRNGWESAVSPKTLPLKRK
jgi:Transcription initiation factor TFIID component TAF4 family